MEWNHDVRRLTTYETKSATLSAEPSLFPRFVRYRYQRGGSAFSYRHCGARDGYPGFGNATMLLKTGDHMHVDGKRGVVELM